MGLEELVKNLDNDDFNFLKKEFPDKWQFLHKKTSYPNDYFNYLDDYKQPVDNLNKEDFFSKLKNECPDDKKIQRTKEIRKLLICLIIKLVKI